MESVVFVSGQPATYEQKELNAQRHGGISTFTKKKRTKLTGKDKQLGGDGRQ
jgi:hypothetical protein